MTQNIGTSTYLSPELEESDSKQGYNEKVDIFALGLILCEMYSKFPTYHERIQTLSDLKKLRELPTALRESFPVECNIMTILVNSDPNNRPSSEELMKCELFS
jgi:serine/threonine protein kinase